MFKRTDENRRSDKSLLAGLEEYIRRNYVPETTGAMLGAAASSAMMQSPSLAEPFADEAYAEESFVGGAYADEEYDEAYVDEIHEQGINERIKHLSDPFSVYLLYLIEKKGMSNADVYKRAIVDKKVFSKIKNNPDYHPQKMTAMCLCVGAKLNIDETTDLLGRAGYALSPSDMTDVIFRYFIENEIYDMIELDIQLEEHGQKCLIS